MEDTHPYLSEIVRWFCNTVLPLIFGWVAGRYPIWSEKKNKEKYLSAYIEGMSFESRMIIEKFNTTHTLILNVDDRNVLYLENIGVLTRINNLNDNLCNASGKAEGTFMLRMDIYTFIRNKT